MLYPTLKAISAARNRLQKYTDCTPSIELNSITLAKSVLGRGLEFMPSLSCFRKRVAFKAQRCRSTIYCSSAKHQLNATGLPGLAPGNHAIAVAYAARRLGSSAKLSDAEESAQPSRIEQCEAYGGEVVLASTTWWRPLSWLNPSPSAEQRAFIHPFSGMHTLEGSGVVGLEMTEQMPHLRHYVLLPIGGGGLCAGDCRCFTAELARTCTSLGLSLKVRRCNDSALSVKASRHTLACNLIPLRILISAAHDHGVHLPGLSCLCSTT